MQYVSKLNFQSLIIINYTFLIQTYNSQTIISIFLYITITISKRSLFTNFYINIKLIISFYSFQKSIFLSSSISSVSILVVIAISQNSFTHQYVWDNVANVADLGNDDDSAKLRDAVPAVPGDNEV